MLQEERLVQILSIINEKKFVTAEELQKTLYVSLSTVRRDLAELSRRELIIRSHGGAIAMSQNEIRNAVTIDSDPMAQAKQQIAKKAAELVNAGDVIFLAASGTVAPMANYLAEKKSLTVVTNSIQLVNLLQGTNVDVYGTGGLYVERNSALYGNDAIEFISSFNYDKAFFSCHCISSDGILGYNSIQLVPIVRAAMHRANKRICVFTSNKLNKTASRNAFTAKQVDLFITDAFEVPENLAQKTIQA